MAADDNNPLAQVLVALRAKLDAKVEAASGSAQEIQAALERYVQAVNAGAAADVAAKNGLPVPTVEVTPEEAARELLSLVQALPELRNDASSPATKTELRLDEAEENEPRVPTAEGVGPAASFEELMAACEPEHPRPERLPHRELAHPEVLQLMEDFRSYDLANLSTPMFKALAEELAARGRDLQDRSVSDPDGSLGRMFRSLTSWAATRGTAFVFGLSRQHEADWKEKAAAARQRRLALESGEPEGLSHRMRIPAPIVDQVAEEEDEDEDEGHELWGLPRLARLADHGAIVLVGGTRKPEKLDRLCGHTGFEVEWIETSDGGTNSTSSLERRIRDGHVSAVVVLDGLVGHKHYEPVIAAARQANVVVEYGRTAGIGALKQAFEKIEAQLG